MRITTLGPLTVDGRPVGGRRLAAVIQELVGARGCTVSPATLVDAVWRESPPADGKAAVQALVARVRRMGVPVETVSGGYRITTHAVETDAGLARELLEHARALLGAGDRNAARRSADEARSLFPEAPDLGEPGAARLFSDLAALRAECFLAGAGPHNEDDLRRLVARRPPDEPAAALLVRVLAEQGRDAEAQEVMQRLRSDLVEEYGTDPSPVVAEVHLALLRGDLPVTRPRRVPRPVLPTSWQRPGTTMIGREPDLAAVLDGLVTAPLVTVVAGGGAGKTRLAAEVARRTSVPVWVVELAGLRSPEQVGAALLSMLREGSDHRPGGADVPPRDQLRSAAAGLEGLVVLDNCEHLLSAAAEVVADVLDASSGITVLATSRAALGLSGELVHRLDALSDTDAQALLETRARQGGATPAWSAEQAGRLCRRLDNLPLALELAAARLRTMPIDDVLAGLDDRFVLLDDALRGLPERHASLWAMVGWSEELLRPEDRELMQRLCVVPAPFTAGTAAAVAGQADVRTGLSTLVEQSLLVLEAGSRPPRYRMLETVREYGEARLENPVPALAGLLSWGRHRAVDLGETLIGPRQLETLGDLARDQENLLAALRWAHRTGDEAAMVDLAATLLYPMMIRGSAPEISYWTAALLHLDDANARHRSALLRGEGVNADRLVRVCLLIGTYAIISGRLRLAAVANRTVQTVLGHRAPELSSRSAALAAILSVLQGARSEAAGSGLGRLIAHDDPYVSGLGLFIRAATGEMRDGTDPARDAQEAYLRLEAAGDHWGRGMAAQTVASSAADTRTSVDWLTRSVEHMELIGAAQEAHTAQVLLDTRLALAGDAEAEDRLLRSNRDRRADPNGRAEDWDRAQSCLALGNLAWRRQEWPETARWAGELIEATRDVLDPQPHQRVLYQVAAAILHVVVATHQPSDRSAATAAALLRRTGAEIAGRPDSQLLAVWAIGGALLAQHQGRMGEARSLWALARPGAGALTAMFAPAEFTRTTAPLEQPDKPDEPDRPVPAARSESALIRELMMLVL